MTVVHDEHQVPSRPGPFRDGLAGLAQESEPVRMQVLAGRQEGSERAERDRRR